MCLSIAPLLAGCFSFGFGGGGYFLGPLSPSERLDVSSYHFIGSAGTYQSGSAAAATRGQVEAELNQRAYDFYLSLYDYVKSADEDNTTIKAGTSASQTPGLIATGGPLVFKGVTAELDHTLYLENSSLADLIVDFPLAMAQGMVDTMKAQKFVDGQTTTSTDTLSTVVTVTGKNPDGSDFELHYAQDWHLQRWDYIAR